MAAVIATAIKIYEYSREEIDDSLFDWSDGHWWPDFEEAGIDRCYIAWSDNQAVGYQTINRDGLCVAIEVHPDFHRQGVASALVEDSGCWQPEDNESPDFWAAMEAKFAE